MVGNRSTQQYNADLHEILGILVQERMLLQQVFFVPLSVCQHQLEHLPTEPEYEILKYDDNNHKQICDIYFSTVTGKACF